MANSITFPVCGAYLATILSILSACSGTESTGDHNIGGTSSSLGGTSSIGGSGAAGASTHVNTGGATSFRGTGGNVGNGGITSTGGSGALSSCSAAPSCGPNEIPVRVTSPALGSQQCGCVVNSCSGVLSTCCTNVCATYYANCASYSLDTGLMSCVQNG